jgi:hypothetical protein
MTKETLKRWLDALRSGKYKQFYRQLSNEDNTQFCCLGVLCDVTKEETGGYWNNNYFIMLDDGETIGDNECIPNFVSNKIGIVKVPRITISEENKKKYNIVEVDLDDKHSLVTLNDEYKIGLNGIADLIEESPEFSSILQGQ